MKMAMKNKLKICMSMLLLLSSISISIVLVREFFFLNELTGLTRSHASLMASLKYQNGQKNHLDLAEYSRSIPQSWVIKICLFPHSINKFDKEYVESYNRKIDSLIALE